MISKYLLTFDSIVICNILAFVRKTPSIPFAKGG
jgi:hypothetical protein